MAAYFANISSVNKQIILAFTIMLLLLYPLHLIIVWGNQLQHTQDGVGINLLKLGVIQYAQDNNDHLPPMQSLIAFQQAVYPYEKTMTVFHEHDNVKILFLPNPNLSGKRLGAIKKLTVLLYESAPANVDDSRWVSFVPHLPGPPLFGDPDFTDLRLVKEKEWQKLRVANNIP